VNRHAWLQKHPTPLATRGEFHWYPAAPEPADRELRASFVERVRGIEPPAVLWQLEAGRVAWGQVFSAIAPTDGRRYVGLVLSIIEGDGLPADLLAMLVPPAAAPWVVGVQTESAAPRHPSDETRTRPAAEHTESLRGSAAAPRSRDEPSSTRTRSPGRETARAPSRALEARRASRNEAGGGGVAPSTSEAARSPLDVVRGEDAGTQAGEPARPEPVELEVFPRPLRGDVPGVARALLAGGSAKVDDPTSFDLPRWIASIERVLPTAIGKPRCGVWSAAESTGPAAGARDRVAELAAAAWREPGSRAARAWSLLCELAVARRESLDQVGGALEAVDATAVLTPAERTEVAGCRSAVDVLHAWGRGRLDRSSTVETLAARLADLVALRVLARLAAGDDPDGAIAEARWHALLSAPRRAALLAAVAQRTSSLRHLVEGHHV
jgi:hypothetical protein